MGVTGQAVGPAAVASQAGLKAAEHGAHSSEQASMPNGASSAHPGKPGVLSADSLKAFADALVVLFKQSSVVNQPDIRYAVQLLRCHCDDDGLASMYAIAISFLPVIYVAFVHDDRGCLRAECVMVV